MNTSNRSTGMAAKPTYYEIRIQGHLDAHHWADWFGGLALTLEEDGTTRLAGPVVDQADLYGSLRKVRDLGMPLLSVTSREHPPAGQLDNSHSHGDSPMLQPTNSTPTATSLRKAARFAGILYLLIIVPAVFAHFYVPGELIVPGDAGATAANIQASESLFRLGIGSEFFVLLTEIVLSVILYGLFRAVNRTVSLIAAVSRLTMTTIHGINLLNYFFVLLLLSGADYLAVFAPEQVNALVTLFLEAHSYGYAIGITFLTIHVFALGYLIVKSGYVPKVLGILFIIAGFGYLFDSIALLLLNSYETTPVIFALPIAVAEIAFPLWLLVKGVNVQPEEPTSSLVAPQAEGAGV